MRKPDSGPPGSAPGRAIRQAVLLLIAGGWACAEGVTDPGLMVVIVQQPSQAILNEPMVPGVEVRLQDASGSPVTGEVTIAIDPNPCEWPLGGTTTLQAVDGRAVFDDLSLGQVANGYRLAVSSGSAQAFTGPINVGAQAIPGHPLVLETTLCLKPNDQRDAEALEYEPQSDVFWLADDDVPSIFEVDRATGTYLSQIPVASFLAAFPGAGQCDDADNDPVTSCSYVDEFEHVAYDETAHLLYVMNTVNNPVQTPRSDRGAMFRLRRGGAGCSDCWSFDSWRALPDGQYEGYEGMVTVDGVIYVVLDERMYRYDYETNRVFSTDANGDSLPPAYDAGRSIRRAHYDGTYLWTIVSPLTVKKIVWETGVEVASYEVGAFGIEAPRGIETIGNRIYVLEGSPPNPIYVFIATP